VQKGRILALSDYIGKSLLGEELGFAVGAK